MARKTEQEVSRTLEFLNETDLIEIDPAFVDRVCSRTAGISGGNRIKYRNLKSSAMIALILLILNITTSLVLYKDRKPAEGQTNSYANIMANEYLSDRNAEMAF